MPPTLAALARHFDMGPHVGAWRMVTFTTATPRRAGGSTADSASAGSARRRASYVGAAAGAAASSSAPSSSTGAPRDAPTADDRALEALLRGTATARRVVAQRMRAGSTDGAAEEGAVAAGGHATDAARARAGSTSTAATAFSRSSSPSFSQGSDGSAGGSSGGGDANVDVCVVCRRLNSESLPVVCCDGCPRSMCLSCLGLDKPPKDDTWL